MLEEATPFNFVCLGVGGGGIERGFSTFREAVNGKEVVYIQYPL